MRKIGDQTDKIQIIGISLNDSWLNSMCWEKYYTTVLEKYNTTVPVDTKPGDALTALTNSRENRKATNLKFNKTVQMLK